MKPYRLVPACCRAVSLFFTAAAAVAAPARAADDPADVAQRAKAAEDAGQWCKAATLRLDVANTPPLAAYARSRNWVAALDDGRQCLAAPGRCANPAEGDAILGTLWRACEAASAFDDEARKAAAGHCTAIAGAEACARDSVETKATGLEKTSDWCGAAEAWERGAASGDRSRPAERAITAWAKCAASSNDRDVANKRVQAACRDRTRRGGAVPVEVMAACLGAQATPPPPTSKGPLATKVGVGGALLAVAVAVVAEVVEAGYVGDPRFAAGPNDYWDEQESRIQGLRYTSWGIAGVSVGALVYGWATGD